MKVLIVLLSVSSVALASLEPQGYRPPGSSGSSQYLPPHHHQDHQHQHDFQQQRQQHPGNSASSQYLPPNYDRPTAPPTKPSSQYLPPISQQQSPPVPSSNYLPAADKPQQPSRPIVVAPANDYLPPRLPSVPSRPANDYLPPVTRPRTTPRPSTTPAPPANDYLPPKRPSAPVPANDYLPPLPSAPRNSPVPAPKTEYLPPHLSDPSTALPPKSDYLPPSRASSPRTSPTTPVPRISIVSVSPFKLDGPSYTNQRVSQPQQQQQQQQTRYSGASSGLSTSASSGFAQTAGGYSAGSSSGYQSASKSYSGSYEQPADNYLPPVSRTSDAGRTGSDQSGYRYDAARSGADAGGSYVEQSTEPAKYDFEYRVSDEYGNDYSHKESRSGSQTHGSYSVLLPDGRKQIVHYEADENGFKPRISYEEAATVLGPKAAQAGDLGFSGYDGNSLDAAHGPY